MRTRTRVAATVLGIAAFFGGGAATAEAMTQPPQCIRNCSPIELDTTGPCYGVIIGNVEANNLCYLGPPPPA